MISAYLSVCFLITILALVSPVPIKQDKTENDILFYDNVNDGSGNYRFSFETADETKREETGQVVNAGQPDQYIQVFGSYSYKYDTPDGIGRKTVYYTAGKEGFVIIDTEKTGVFTNAVPPAVLATLAG